jgi:hypothetical protein
MKITLKLPLAFVAVLALLTVCVVFSMLRISSIGRATDEMRLNLTLAVHSAAWVQATRLNINRMIAVAKSSDPTELTAHFNPLIKKTSDDNTMTEVVSSIKRVTDIMGEISAASVEQSAGVAQVGEAITQMDQATQQNAALVEGSAAAAESLKGQAQQRVGAVAVFKHGGVECAYAAAHPSSQAEKVVLSDFTPSAELLKTDTYA